MKKYAVIAVAVLFCLSLASLAFAADVQKMPAAQKAPARDAMKKAPVPIPSACPPGFQLEAGSNPPERYTCRRQPVTCPAGYKIQKTGNCEQPYNPVPPGGIIGTDNPNYVPCGVVCIPVAAPAKPACPQGSTSFSTLCEMGCFKPVIPQ